MSATKELKVRISADTSGFSSEVNKMSKSMSSMSKTIKDNYAQIGEGLKNIGTKMTVVGAGIVASIGGIVSKGAEWSAQVEGQKFLYNNLDKAVQKSIDSNSKNAQTIGLTAQQYKNSATTIATYYKNMGMTTDETSKLSGETMNLVADLAAVVDMPFDEAMSRFKSGLMGNYEALDTFGINLSANTLQNSEFVKSLGKSWNQLSDNEKMLAAYNEILRQSGPMTGLAAQEAESFGMKFKLLKQQISETVGQIGSNLLPVLEPLVQKLSDVATRVSEWVAENPKLTQTILTIVGGIGVFLATLGPLLVLVGSLITSFAGLTTIAGALGVGVGALVGIFGSVIGIVVAVVAAIAGFIAIVVKAYKENETFRNTVNTVFNNIKSIISNVMSVIKDVISMAWSVIKVVWDNGLKQILQVALTVLATMASNFTSRLNTITSIVRTVVSTIKSIFSGDFSSISNVVNNVLQKVVSAFNSKMESAKSAISKGINAMKNMFNITFPTPKIKLPRISVSGSFSLNPPSVPKFGISWYSKGAIFKRPTVLGGMGIGDAHNGIGSNAEAILPINQLPKLLGLDKMQNSGVTLSIENFNNNTDRDIEYLPNELAYFMKRKALV